MYFFESIASSIFYRYTIINANLNYSPINIISEKGIQQGDLDQTRVLIIPNAAYLADKTAEAIERAVNQGMGLLVTYMTGYKEANGSLREKPILSEMLGYKLLDIRTPYSQATLSRHPDLKVSDIDRGYFYYASARQDHAITSEIDKDSDYEDKSFGDISPLLGG